MEEYLKRSFVSLIMEVSTPKAMIMLPLLLNLVGSNRNDPQNTILVSGRRYEISGNKTSGFYDILKDPKHPLTCEMCTGNTYIRDICTLGNSKSQCLPCPDGYEQRETGFHFNNECHPKLLRWKYKCELCPGGRVSHGCRINENGKLETNCCLFNRKLDKLNCKWYQGSSSLNETTVSTNMTENSTETKTNIFTTVATSKGTGEGIEFPLWSWLIIIVAYSTWNVE